MSSEQEQKELQEELYEEYQAGRFEAAARLSYRREEIKEVTGLSMPTSLRELQAWYDRMSPVLSRLLNPDNEETPSDIEDDNSDIDNNGGDNNENDDESATDDEDDASDDEESDEST